MNSSLSIEEVVLINNLLYIENLGGPKGTFMSPSQESKTIGDYVRGVFKNEDLIEDDTEYSDGVTGAEYRQILGAIRKNQHLLNMIIMQVHFESDSAGGGRSVFLCDPSSNEAIIVFKGTQSDAEWVDNIAGLYQVPTAFQENALKWFKSLPLEGYDIITVTGHSKGGNKAKYLVIMDDRIDNCFSFDGQGFSDEFIHEYSAEIRRNEGKNLNINAESDFVNILLNDVGPKKYFLGTNYGRLGFGENHCANAVLFFDDEDNVSMWEAQQQDKKMADLDLMLNSFIRSYPMSTRENIGSMLGNIILSAFHGNTDTIIGTFSDDKYKDNAAELTAFILRYKEKKPQMVASLKEILKQNGVDTAIIGVIDFITNHALIMEAIGENPTSIIQILELNEAPAAVTDFLSQHKELFAFIVNVSHRMKRIDPTRYKGDDLVASEDGFWPSLLTHKDKRVNLFVMIAIALAVVILLVLLFLIF